MGRTLPTITQQIAETESMLRGFRRTLRRMAPVVITLAPPLLEERAFLVERVCAQADTLFTLELPASQPYQPELL